MTLTQKTVMMKTYLACAALLFTMLLHSYKFTAHSSLHLLLHSSLHSSLHSQLSSTVNSALQQPTLNCSNDSKDSLSVQDEILYTLSSLQFKLLSSCLKVIFSERI